MRLLLLFLIAALLAACTHATSAPETCLPWMRHCYTGAVRLRPWTPSSPGRVVPGAAPGARRRVRPRANRVTPPAPAVRVNTAGYGGGEGDGEGWRWTAPTW